MSDPRLPSQFHNVTTLPFFFLSLLWSEVQPTSGPQRWDRHVHHNRWLVLIYTTWWTRVNQLHESDGLGLNQFHESDGWGLNQLHESGGWGLNQLHESDGLGLNQFHESDGWGLNQLHESDGWGLNQLHESDGLGLNQRPVYCAYLPRCCYFASRSGCEVLWWVRVCVYVWLCDCLYASISPEPRVQFLSNFFACSLIPMAVAQSSYGIVVICYVLPVLWITLCFFCNGLCSGMNFAVNDWFRLYLLYLFT